MRIAKRQFSIIELADLCRMQCTKKECASWFGFSEDSLEDRLREALNCTFQDFFYEYRGEGRISLRRAQWRKAIEENDTKMLQWLGSNYLGQSAKVEQQTEHSINPLTKELIDEYTKEY